MRLLRIGQTGAAALLAIGVSACATVRLEAPKDPIRIDLNVKIDQEVRVKLDKEVEDLIANNPDAF
ncbi:MAG: YnbE family lipoprotein [Hyphomonadaceae bacterium]